ncbi:AAA family ATPase [Parasutterella sp.]|jgi:abortive phage resistance protein-like|uniref:AAA family ATPase n=2 Tax=Parasutterella sp. TaxID=2049037 RepID=UPI003AF99920
MLIEFKFSNFLSYKEMTSFSMVAGKERTNSKTLASIPKFRLKLLPLAAIYGANASGKSNLIKALGFLKTLVTTQRVKGKIPLRHFYYSEDKNTISNFEISFLVNELIYEFKIACNEDGLLYEELIERNSRSEKTLYLRDKDKVQINPKINSHDAIQCVADRSLNRPCPLLTTLSSMKFKPFEGVFRWFSEELKVIHQDSFLIPYGLDIGENDSRNTLLSEVLRGTDTGISALVSTPVSESSLRLLPSERNELLSTVCHGSQLIKEAGGGRLLAYFKDGDLAFRRLNAAHEISGKEYLIPLEEESTGTKKIIDLAPAIIDLLLSKKNCVYVIDGIDHGLHMEINYWLVRRFLENVNSNTRKQLIFTSQDTNLLRRAGLRRDEIWFVERRRNSPSQLVNAIEFKGLRIDSSLQKLYEEGRLGALPIL